MVRHSHHHVPAHIGGVRYVPPCCGCGGINRSNLRREIAEKNVKDRAGLENLQNMQKASQKELVPQFVRDMAGIKLKQQLSTDTITFAKVLQQKGVSKEKALEKLLDKLVGMYASEKELMKALKNMEMSKLLELLKKALSTVNESNLGEEETLKKKIKKTNEKGDIIHKNENAEKEDSENDPEENENEERKEEKRIKTGSKKERKSKHKTRKLKHHKQKDDHFEKERELSPEVIDKESKEAHINKTIIANSISESTENEAKIETKKTIPINLNENNIKLSGNSYSINAVNLLKEQEDIEINRIRQDKLYNDKHKKTENPLIKESPKSDSLNEAQDKKTQKIIEEKRLKELENENNKLKQLIMNLQKERRETLIAGFKND